jgi:succinate dehydrogenase / fumarate reductase cytochrome b subunit
MRRLAALYRTTVGKKAVVALTGLLLVAFLAMHAVGNLSVFSGTDASGVPYIDLYAAFLAGLGGPLLPEGAFLWGFRLALLAIFLLHLWTVIALARENRTARPLRYAQKRRLSASLAATWMLWSGLFLVLFVVVHLANFLLGSLAPFRFQAGAVYANLYHAFEVWYLAGFYLLAMAALALHLYHGVWSLFQTLGIDRPGRNRLLRGVAIAGTVLITGAFAAVPLSFLSGRMAVPGALTAQLPDAPQAHGVDAGRVPPREARAALKRHEG